MTVTLEGMRKLPPLPPNQVYFLIGPGGSMADVERARPILAKVGKSFVVVHVTW